MTATVNMIYLFMFLLGSSFFRFFSLMFFLFMLFLMHFGYQFLFFIDHSFHTVIHILYEINFRTTESSLVGDIINVVISLCVLSVGTSNLDMELVSNSLEIGFMLTQER